jgi:predicted sulfurtransferase
MSRTPELKDKEDLGEEERKKKKKEKKRKKEKKKRKESKKRNSEKETCGESHRKKRKETHKDEDAPANNDPNNVTEQVTIPTVAPGDDLIVETSALDQSTIDADKQTNSNQHDHDVTLLLFYQYVEPPWDSDTYHSILKEMQHLGDSLHLTGRMRVAKEGLNCTLTTCTHDSILQYCKALRRKPEFKETEFKLTRDLPHAQAFPSLKVMPVTELVHYGLVGEKAPPMEYTGVHLQPRDYHDKMEEDNTVVIDVRNHYEAAIGHFAPPGGAANKWLDPKMRKSTEFPLWLDKQTTKEKLKGKQVLMYCTGGVRCERASALLKYKMETDPSIKDLGIQGVYQLQGGIDKYFKQFPNGGHWAGKNYTFDKRFAHAPPKAKKEQGGDETVMGKCEACHKPWDMYRGKRRCPTCGVPSLICRECFQADKDGIRKLDRNIRCTLCVEENVTSKAQLKQREQQELEEYESKQAEKGIKIQRTKTDKSRGDGHAPRGPAPNPNGVTRLLLKNMCRKSMDEATLMETIPGITHIVWRTDRKTRQFFGSGWVEMATPEDASVAVGMSGIRVVNRPLYISYESPDGKDAWPPPSSKVQR